MCTFLRLCMAAVRRIHAHSVHVHLLQALHGGNKRGFMRAWLK